MPYADGSDNRRVGAIIADWFLDWRRVVFLINTTLNPAAQPLAPLGTQNQIMAESQKRSEIGSAVPPEVPPPPPRDSFNLEAGRLSFRSMGASKEKADWITTLKLGFQCIGVIFGDLGTSPLYVLPSTFPDGIRHQDDLLGVLSLIIYTLGLIPLLKYTFIVLWANDNGDGGTFALYSLLSRHAKVSLVPNQQSEDGELSHYKLEARSSELKRSCKIKEALESSKFAKVLLFLVTILGTSLIMGDGILTPSISVLSAVSGIKSLGNDAVVGISVVILIALFMVQRFGTDKVGYSFAPLLCVWFLFSAGIGLYNIFAHNVGVLRAFNPYYIFDYFRRNGRRAWTSLGGVILCTTGAEAMFADLGHFNIRAVQISFSTVVFPAVLAQYAGQIAYLSKNPEDVADAFYKAVPRGAYWPMFVVAVTAAVIASQALISGAFAVISQSLTLYCFPRVKVIHTSAKYTGQVYIPEINYLLLLACVLVTVGFKTTVQLGNAYGIAVIMVMTITTCMATLVMLLIWKINIWWIVIFFAVFFSLEFLYLSAALYKFVDGGWLPLGFALFLMSIMGTWHYVHTKKYNLELANKLSSDSIRQLVSNPRINRAPGIGLFFSELVHGIPPIFPHFVANIPTIQSVLVFVSIKKLPTNRVEPDERFLFQQVETREHRMFRCVVRYGYKDAMEGPEEFEQKLVEGLVEFINEEQLIAGGGGSPEEEVEFLRKAKEEGVVYLLGEAEVVAKPDSRFLKKIIVNYVYNFLNDLFRHGVKVMAIPQTRLLRVGITYEI